MKTTQPGNVLPAVLEGFASTRLSAIARDAGGAALNAADLLRNTNDPSKWIEDQENQQLIFKDSFEFCGLQTDVILCHQFRTLRVEGTIFFSNSLDARGVFANRLSIACLDGEGEMLPRAMIPHALTPDAFEGDYGEWKLRTTEINPGNMVPFLFVLTYGKEKAGEAVRMPRWIKRKGRFVIPDPEDTNEARLYERRRDAQTDWFLFNHDTTAYRDERYLFGEYGNTGSAGDQPHLGHHPIANVTDPQIASDFAADHMRAKVFWIEGFRRYHWENIPFTKRGSEPGSFYNFYGPHTTSKFAMGYTYDRNTGQWTPSLGDTHGILGYGLEHFRSRVPELAYYTQDPAAFELTARIARVLLCTLHSDYYYGGQYTTLRGMLRPLAEMIECVVALESSAWTRVTYKTELEMLYQRIGDKIAWLDENGFAKDAWNPNEQIAGHETEKVIEVWQAGFADYLYGWHQYTGSQAALRVVAYAQNTHIASWKGTDRRDLMMPKFVLASDVTIGRGYGRRLDGLTLWNAGLMSIPDVPGVDQAKRVEIYEAIRLEYPDAGLDGKNGVGDWNEESIASARRI